MMLVCSFLSLFFFLLTFFLILKLFFLRKKNEYILEKNRKENPKFTILIPARDESNVIEDLLESIEKQTRKISMQDVYVIVESENDPTVLICKRHNTSVIVRKHLEGKSKGYALKEAILFLKKIKKFYDAYFIFDADNVLDKDYLLEMEKDYQMGYAISTGYRNIKNGQKKVLSVACTLTYIILNEWLNKKNCKYQKNILLSGTGFYIDGNYIKEWGTYPFCSLTEDVELSYYATLMGISTHYNSKACFYDEQPESFKQSVIQRKRWICGYFQNWKHYCLKFKKRLKENPFNYGSVYSMMIGISPILCLVIGVVLLLIGCFYTFIKNGVFYQIFSWKLGILFLSFLFWIYLILVLITYFIIRKEKGKLKISSKNQFLVLWYHPFFLISYIYVALLALFQHKNMDWEKIEHGKSKN